MQGNRLSAPSFGIVELATAQAHRRETPLRPCSPIPSNVTRATLTVLTGIEAGRLVDIGEQGLVMGRAPDVDLVIDDETVSRFHARIAPDHEGGFSIEDLRSTNGTFVGANRVKRSPLATGDQVQLGREIRLRFRILDAAEELLYRKLYETSVHDPLTRAYNRRYLSDRLIDEVAHAQRTNTEMAVLMIDVDRLKHLNDAFGHLAGDRALCGIVTAISRSIRADDLLARYGGDELAILAPGTSHQEATWLAGRVRSAVEGLRLHAGGKDVRMTVSIGVASLRELGPAEEPHIKLLTLADERLYQAKRSGRSSVFAGGSSVLLGRTLPQASSA
jgi:two-component system, cell cycle response regulator